MIRRRAHPRLPAWLALTLILGALALLGASNRPALANWPGQNGKIAFSTIQQQSGPQGGTDTIGIGTMDPDGSHRTISDTTSLGVVPLSWSADGTKLATVDRGAATPQISYLTFENGVFNGSSGVTAGTFATWIPDNLHLIVAIQDDLVVIGLNGLVVQQLTTTPGIREVDAALSPDLSTIVFSSNEDPDEDPAMPPKAGSFYNLWIMNSSGTGRHVLVRTDNANNESFQPDWKPDSSAIVYQDNGDLWTVPPTGLTPVQLTNDALIEGLPSWSPDGKLIAYNQGAAGSVGTEIWLIDPLTKARTRVTPDPANQSDLFPSWQPIGHITAPNYYVWGANTCGPQPAAKDVLRTLRYLAGVQTAATTGCPPMGQHGLTSTNIEGHWGDLDCSGTIDTGDVLLHLQYLLEVGPFATEDIDYNPVCPPIGSYLQWIALP